MLKPTRTILALAAGSLVLGLVGAGTSVADGQPVIETASQQTAAAGMRHTIGRVVSRGPLKVRSQPSTRARIVGQVYPDRTVEIRCKKYGESVDGNRVWYRLYSQNGNNQNGNGNGNGNNGDNGNGDNGNVTWPTGPNASGSGVSENKAAGTQRWVAARYVQNLGTVRFCR